MLGSMEATCSCICPPRSFTPYFGDTSVLRKDMRRRRQAAGGTDLVIRNVLVVKSPTRIRWKPVLLAPVQQKI